MKAVIIKETKPNSVIELIETEIPTLDEESNVLIEVTGKPSF